MNWFRLAKVEYPREIAAKHMAHIPENTWPRYLTLESSDPKGEAESINVVYYSDIEMNKFINDFHFDSLDDAISFCENELGVKRHTIEFFDEGQTIY